MSRGPRSDWRKLFDRVLADPAAAIAEVKRYARDVAAGADPIEAIHGHVCSKDCWHEQMKVAFGKTRGRQ
jgi:hypothetical protein